MQSQSTPALSVHRTPAVAPAERERLLAAAVALRHEVGRRIVGQEAALEEILLAILAGGTRCSSACRDWPRH